jgi:hypothetical protein
MLIHLFLTAGHLSNFWLQAPLLPPVTGVMGYQDDGLKSGDPIKLTSFGV